MEALVRTVEDLFRQLINRPQMLRNWPSWPSAPTIRVRLAYLTASSMRIKVEGAQELLEVDVHDKLRRLTQLLNKEVEVLELGRKIQSGAHGEMERMQASSSCANR
ncbi:MAG: hypothetical protein R3A10_14170 [Caldilineaceae bacterium]